MPRSGERVTNPEEAFAALPDPAQAGSLTDLVELLRRLKVWAGNPSYERIKDRVNVAWTAAGRPAGELTGKSTVAYCFQPGRRRLDTELVAAIVQVLHPDIGYVTQWRQALRVVAGEIEAVAQIRVQDSLPPDLAGFTGRDGELDRLRQAAQGGGAVVISAIDGMAGVGKTRLAVHAGHMFHHEEPFDQVLFVDLRGFHPDPAQLPADPAAVLDGFLRLLGVPGQQIPHGLGARAALYRDRLAGKRALVLLDNATGAEQVQPLLPGTPGCLTLVTSRRSLIELRQATRLTVDVFTPDDAVGFLSLAAAEVALATDPDAKARIAQRCGYLPLALSLLAGHIRGTPGWTLTDHADRLDERHHHRKLDTGIQLALDLSYQHLSADRQRLLRMAALHPGQDFDVYAAAAALTDARLRATQDRLRHLCRDHLLQETTSGRYSFHDLVRAFASDRAIDEDRPTQRQAALTRLFGFFLATASAAMDAIYPHERHLRPAVAPARTARPDLADRERAGQWLETELASLLATARHAAAHGAPQHTWQLSATLDRHVRVRGRFGEAQTLHQHALQLACQHGNQVAEMNALNGLAYADRMRGRYEQAAQRCARALQIAQDIGDRSDQRLAFIALGHAQRMLGRYEQAAHSYGRALQIAQDIGDRTGQRHALTGLGDVNWLLGRYQLATDYHGRALQMAQAIGDRSGEQGALNGLGHLYRMLGRYQCAGDHHRRALQIAQAIGDRSGEQNALNGLGHAHRMLGHHSEAVNRYQQVLDLADKFGNSNWKFEALQGLGRLHHAIGQPHLALAHHRQALQCATGLAQPSDQARAHDGLAHAHHTLNQHGQARRHWRRALDILTGLGAEHTEEPEAGVANIRAHLSRQPRE